MSRKEAAIEARGERGSRAAIQWMIILGLLVVMWLAWLGRSIVDDQRGAVIAVQKTVDVTNVETAQLSESVVGADPIIINGGGGYALTTKEKAAPATIVTFDGERRMVTGVWSGVAGEKATYRQMKNGDEWLCRRPDSDCHQVVRQ